MNFYFINLQFCTFDARLDVTSLTFHERGTIICTIPPRMGPNTGPVPVQVSNDGLHYCDARVFFVYAG